VNKAISILAGLLLATSGAFPLLAREPSPEGEGKKKESKEKKVKLGARIHSLWTLADNPAEIEKGVPGADNEFSMEMARLEVQWSPRGWLDAKLQGDFEQLMGDGNAEALLRDAWVRVSPLRWLKFKAGQSKRPFSLFELRSRGRLETVHRGASNGWIINDLGYGERDIGLPVEGRVGKKREANLHYALGVYNGSGRNERDEDPDGSKDFVARIEGSPVRWLTLGINGSLKLFDHDEFSKRPDSAWMSGADLRFKMGRFRLYVEGLFGQNHDQCRYTTAPSVCRLMDEYSDVPYSWSVAAMAAYKIPLYPKWKFSLQPVLKGEYFMPDHELDDGRIVTASAGANFFFTKYFRVMMHGELVSVEAEELREDW